MVKICRPFFRNPDSILKNIKQVLTSGILMDGKFNKDFEKRYAKFIGVKYAIAVNSCTTALEIVLRFINVKNKEVILPTNTFIATSNAVIFAGGKPVVVDIKENNYNISVKEIIKKISKKTIAVIIVHIAGIPVEDIYEIKKICAQNNIFLIEDCAHSPGAVYKNKMTGSFALAGCFSFYPTKIITTGTGGMITTNSPQLDRFARSVKCHGRSKKGLAEITNIGNDWFLDEIRAAIGLQQLKQLEYNVSIRRKITARYLEEIKKIKKLYVFDISDDSQPAYYKFPVQLDKSISADIFKRFFKKKYDIELESVYWPPMHLQPIYKKIFSYKKGNFPIAEGILSQQLCLPIHPLISEKDIQFLINSLKESLR